MIRQFAIVVACMACIGNARRLQGLKHNKDDSQVRNLGCHGGEELMQTSKVWGNLHTFATLFLALSPMMRALSLRRKEECPTSPVFGVRSRSSKPRVSASSMVKPQLAIRRIWAISDIHTDVQDNLRFIESIDSFAHRSDVLIVAGDISDSTDIVRTTLRSLRPKFAKVFFVVGNHELWVRWKQPHMDSLQKMRLLEKVCKEEGVDTRPELLHAEGTGHRVWIVPLLSWHCQSFDCEPGIDSRWEGIPSAERLCGDYRLCRWPSFLNHSDDSVAAFLDAINDEAVNRRHVNERDALQILFNGVRKHDEVVVSFSHFLPRMELLPEKRFLRRPSLSKFVGSTFLGDRLSQLRPDVHIFGHTHFGWDQIIDGVRYMSAPLSTPRERSQRIRTIATGTFPRAAVRAGNYAAEPLLVWDAADGFPETYEAAWSGFYDSYQREPELVTALPDYVAQKCRWDKSKHGPKPKFIWPQDKLPPWSFSPGWTTE